MLFSILSPLIHSLSSPSQIMESKVRVLLSKGPGAGAGRTVAMTQLEEKLKFVTRFGTKWQAFIGRSKRVFSCLVFCCLTLPCPFPSCVASWCLVVPVFESMIFIFCCFNSGQNVYISYHQSYVVHLANIIFFRFYYFNSSIRLSCTTPILGILCFRGESFFGLRCGLLSTQRTHGTGAGTGT